MRIAKIYLFLITLLLPGAGYGQFVKVSIDGFQRRTQFNNTVYNNGPLNVNTADKRYSYGLTASYEEGENGAEIGLSNFPYRVDLRFNHFFSIQSGPSNIALFSLLYKRRLVNLKSCRLALYGLVGVSGGKYSNSNLKEGTGTVAVNGSIIYQGHLDRYSDYTRSLILLPTFKIAVDKNLASKFIISIHAAYLLKNWLNTSEPLEQGDYTYTYSHQTGTGKLADYGSSFFLGIALKYQFSLSKKHEEGDIEFGRRDKE